MARISSPKGLAALSRYNIKATGFAGGFNFFMVCMRLRKKGVRTGLLVVSINEEVSAEFAI